MVCLIIKNAERFLLSLSLSPSLSMRHNFGQPIFLSYFYANPVIIGYDYDYYDIIVLKNINKCNGICPQINMLFILHKDNSKNRTIK